MKMRWKGFMRSLGPGLEAVSGAIASALSAEFQSGQPQAGRLQSHVLTSSLLHLASQVTSLTAPQTASLI